MDSTWPEWMIERKRVRDGVAGCRGCGLVERCNGPVPFSGPSEPLFVVLGEAPGKQEDELRSPFVGPSGGLLRQGIADEGVDVESVAFVNTVSCFPNRTPTGREIAACAGNRESQLAHLRTDYVLVVGGVALSAVWGSEVRVSEFAGRWFRGMADRWYFATYHPSAVLRNRQLAGEFAIHLGHFVNGVVSRPWVSYHCIKCSTYTEMRVGPGWVTDEWGVPMCPKHVAVARGIVGGVTVTKPKSTRSSPKSRNRSAQETLL